MAWPTSWGGLGLVDAHGGQGVCARLALQVHAWDGAGLLSGPCLRPAAAQPLPLCRMRPFSLHACPGGDMNVAPTIVAPKVQVHKPAAPPPPVPVTQQPLWMRNQAPSFPSAGNRFGRPSFSLPFGSSAGSQQPQQSVEVQPPSSYGSSGSRGGGGSYNNVPPPPSIQYNAVPPPRTLSSAGPASAAQSAQAAVAIAAAQAIAARLAAQAGAGAGGALGQGQPTAPGFPPPPTRNRWDNSQ